MVYVPCYYQGIIVALQGEPRLPYIHVIIAHNILDNNILKFTFSLRNYYDGLKKSNTVNYGRGYLL